MTASISIVIPCYRCAATIERAVESIFEQTLLPAEVILVDDHSGDDTYQKLNLIRTQYGANFIRLVSLPENGGPGKARNVGWDLARSKYVAFLDSDDSWHPQKLEIQFHWMERNPSYVITGHTCSVNGSGKGLAHDEDMGSFSTVFSPITLKALLWRNRFSTQTMMIRRDIPFRFKDDKRHCEDYLLACEICASGRLCAVSAAPLSILHKEAFGAGGLSGQLWRMWQGELEVYQQLHSAGKIGAARLVAITMFSLLRFARRCFYVLFRKVRQLRRQ